MISSLLPRTRRPRDRHCIKPGVLQSIAKEGIDRMITFQDWHCGSGEMHFLTHASGPMTPFVCEN